MNIRYGFWHTSKRTGTPWINIVLDARKTRFADSSYPCVERLSNLLARNRREALGKILRFAILRCVIPVVCRINHTHTYIVNSVPPYIVVSDDVRIHLIVWLRFAVNCNYGDMCAIRGVCSSHNKSLARHVFPFYNTSYVCDNILNANHNRRDGWRLSVKTYFL
jgi:hypothetical protein